MGVSSILFFSLIGGSSITIECLFLGDSFRLPRGASKGLEVLLDLTVQCLSSSAQTYDRSISPGKPYWNCCWILPILYSSSLAASQRSGSTQVTVFLSASLRVLQRYSSSGSYMLKSIQRYLYRLWMSSRPYVHIWNSFYVNFLLLESITYESFPFQNLPYTHFIYCGQTKMPCPWNCPFENSPTYLLPLLKYFSPNVSNCDCLQQPRSILLRQRLFWPLTATFSPYMRKANPCTYPSPSKQPTVSSFPSCLTCIVSGFSKVKAKACSCFRPIRRATVARLKASSLPLRFRCKILSTRVPRLKTNWYILRASQSISRPAPWALSLFSVKGILMMALPILYAISQSLLDLKRTDAMELSRKITLWPVGVSWRYYVMTAAPSSCSSSPRPCFLYALMPPWYTALLQWQKYFQ